MTRIASSLKINILSFSLISLVMLAVLWLVYFATKEFIKNAKNNAELEKIKSVLPAFDNNPLDSAKTFDELVFYTAKKGDSIIGFACKTFTERGFNGKFSLMVGFLPNGTIYKTIILEQNETPGFGSRMKSKWHEQFNGKDPAKYNLTVKKDGGDVDAISSATISSRAYCDAIETAYLSLMKNILKKADTVTTSEPSETNNTVELKKDSNIIKKDSVVAAPMPAKPAIFQFSDKSIFNDAIPAFDNDPLKDFKSVNGLDIYIGKKNGVITGYAITSFSNKGYGGKVIILVGFNADGSINNTSLVQHNETQGLGSQVGGPDFKDQFKGKNPALFKLQIKAEGGDVDAVSGATFSSRAFCDALQKAYYAFLKAKK